MQDEIKYFATKEKRKEMLILHVDWLTRMAEKQFPKHGLTEEEIERSKEVMELLYNAPIEMFKECEVIPIRGDEQIKKFINRIDGIED